MKTEIQWWQQPVVYQIYPRSFNDSNGDGIGDLPGITEKIPYLAKLGIDVIWLSPIYASPNDDNGYDISDYRAIMTEFGTMADFDELLATAHEHGIKLMMDLVVNHTSDEHEWFHQARSAKDNPYRDYYVWRDPAGFSEDGTPIPPNNWISCFSPSVWEWDEGTQQFYLHYFSVKQPDLNWENPKVREEVYDIMRFWLDKGVDGFRMDVINLISKDLSFPDDPAVTAGGLDNSLAVAANGPRVHEFLREMNREVLSKYPVMTVGETPCVSVEDAALYTGFDRHELQMVFQFEHMDVDASAGGATGKWSDTRFNLVDLKKVLTHWQTGLHGRGWNSLYWNNHDQPRTVSRFGNDSPEFREVSGKMLGTVLHMMQGTPYIYQGEELGMTNVFFDSVDDYNDLEIHDSWRKYVVESQRVSPEDMLRYISASGRDNARTPMQWDASENAGFTTGTPWLKVNPRYTDINAAEELANDDSIFYHYSDLIHLRKEHPIVLTGEYRVLNLEDEQVYAYLRVNSAEDAAVSGERALLVVANFTQETLSLPYADGQLASLALKNPGVLKIEELAAMGEAPELISSNYRNEHGEFTDEGTTLRPYEAKVYLYR
ncbi:glucohydrolase [Rothia sp. HMSC065D02]|uniref:glycoside hydrolase family 13 protein n=1 Tax=Rothia sp. HMSC065D02 TaxID=1739518 RepID=UPI0008A211E6|nr:alpha-glucosidase [Rothia sp. HMSC065D02]OFO78308.1 glucohydrolase [Rothia sp. HMSC065D02]